MKNWSRVILGADHAGFPLKQQIYRILTGHLRNLVDAIEDFGVHTDAHSVDYPDIALQVARAVATLPGSCGILVCGTGIGMGITANKVPGIRAAVCHNLYTIQMARQHNNANVLCLGARVLGEVPDERLEEWLSAWLTTPFEGGRHERRVQKIMQAESVVLGKR